MQVDDWSSTPTDLGEMRWSLMSAEYFLFFPCKRLSDLRSLLNQKCHVLSSDAPPFHSFYFGLCVPKWVGTSSWSPLESLSCGGRWGSSAGQQPRLHEVPLLPQDEQQQGQQDGGGHPGSGLHQRGDEVGQGGDEHQQHGHERKDHVDEFAQQSSGVGVLHSLQLDDLLLLLLQLQLGDAGQARLHSLLRVQTHTWWSQQDFLNTTVGLKVKTQHSFFTWMSLARS